MDQLPLPLTPPSRLPKLAAMALVLWGLSAGPLQAATLNKPVANAPIPEAQGKQTPAETDADPLHILSQADAASYRAAFTAQEKEDWKAADAALAKIKDKRLMGHVLADRYTRHAPTLIDLKAWMAENASLPEAETLYANAAPLKGFAQAGIKHPVGASFRPGTEARTSTGFRVSADTLSPAAEAILADLKREDPSIARERLETEKQRGTLSPEESARAAASIAASFFYQGQIERAAGLARKAAEGGVPLGFWIAGLSAWKQGDDEAALSAFSQLGSNTALTPWDRATGAYWAYRAASRLQDKEQADHWLREAAKQPHSFYGYLAASLQGDENKKLWALPDLNTRAVSLLASRPAAARALALLQIGQRDLAEAELTRLNPTGKPALKEALVALADHAHMPALALRLSSLGSYASAAYPLPPWEPTDGFKIDRALLFALMKRESRFDPDSVSARGACGLMQLMPATARRIANDNRRSSKEGVCPDSLFDPATNLAMGQRYVRVLAGQPQIGDNLLLLLAAYNGGPGNLSRWMEDGSRKDPLLFIESLPMRETRDYVEEVALHYWMYRSRLAGEANAARLAKDEWPRYALKDDVRNRHAVQEQKLTVASVGR